MSSFVIQKSPPSLMRHEARPAICPCGGKSRLFTFGIALGGLRFQYEQQSPTHHNSGCKYYGIDKRSARVLRGQFPFSMGWFSTRIALASIEISKNMGNLAGSITVRNIVRECAIEPELDNMYIWLRNSRPSRGEMIQRLQSTERTILSLYRDGRASPYDQNLYGQSDFDVRVIKFHFCCMLTYRR